MPKGSCRTTSGDCETWAHTEGEDMPWVYLYEAKRQGTRSIRRGNSTKWTEVEENDQSVHERRNVTVFRAENAKTFDHGRTSIRRIHSVLSGTALYRGPSARDPVSISSSWGFCRGGAVCTTKPWARSRCCTMPKKIIQSTKYQSASIRTSIIFHAWWCARRSMTI
jgi:hypothetical protein